MARVVTVHRIIMWIESSTDLIRIHFDGKQYRKKVRDNRSAQLSPGGSVRNTIVFRCFSIFPEKRVGIYYLNFCIFYLFFTTLRRYIGIYSEDAVCDYTWDSDPLPCPK